MKLRKIRLSQILILTSLILSIFFQKIIAVQAQVNIRPYAVDALDLTPPTIPIVTDDGDFTYNKTQLHATWISSDPESGISEYQYAIGTAAGLTDVVGWTSAGLNAGVTRKGLSLLVNQAYYFSVKAKNGAKLWSQVGYSDGITVLNNPPQINSILPTDNSTFTEGDLINISVQAQDPDNDPLQYRFLVGSQLLQDWSSLNSYSWQTQTGELRLKTITVDVRDNYGGADTQDTHVFLFRKVPGPE